ncbi:unnamed protein product, partial [Clonostachys rosea f. rosea IK726]
MELYTGSTQAEYRIARSFLNKPHPRSPLADIYVAPGSHISGGPTFVICRKDTDLPIRVSPKRFRQKEWIENKFILFWDIGDERGWLVNGSVALLHLVKTSLEHSGRNLSDKSIYWKKELLEPTEPTPVSAAKVLRNSDNMKIKLFADSEECFQDRVDLFLNILEKIIDHQQHICGEDGANLANAPRKYLEG